MLSRENIYRELAVLHAEIRELEHLVNLGELKYDNVGYRGRDYYIEVTCKRYAIANRKERIKELEWWLRRDINDKTFGLTSVYEEDLDYDHIYRNGIRGVKF